MKYTQISNSILSIGTDDKTLNFFQNQYRLWEGISYNSYLIVDEHPAIIDAVPERATDEWLSSLDSALAGNTAEYLILTQAEPDNIPNLLTMLDKYPNLQVVGNAKTFRMIEQFFEIHLAERAITVEEGDTILLGTHVLRFFPTPMLYSPEVMAVYEQTEKLLFSAHAFGSFGTFENSKESENTGNYSWDAEACRYYFNILGKYGFQVQQLLQRMSALELSAICPLHGPVIRENLSGCIDLYNRWSRYEPDNDGTLIVCASMHGHTAKAAILLKEALEKKSDADAVILYLPHGELSKAVAEAFRFRRLVVAAATHSGDIFPPMEDFLRRLQARNYQNHTVGIIENGSWAPASGSKMREYFRKMKQLSVCEPTLTIKSAVRQDTVEAIQMLADTLLGDA